MQREIRKIVKSLGLRGWLFDFESRDKMYLLKFDPIYDNEYRFYFFENGDEYQMVRRVMIFKNGRKQAVEEHHPYHNEARLILNTYYQNRKKRFLVS